VNKTEDMAYWINERQRMFKCKEAKEAMGAGPSLLHGWSNDPAMGIPRYCNVHREDDRVTRWIAKNWRNPNASHPNLVLGMVLARMVNWPETLADIGFPKTWDPEKIKQKMRIREQEGNKVWTSAYTISTCGRSMSKIDYVVDHVCQQVHDREMRLDCSRLSGAHNWLMGVDGLGSFLAAQVIADLKNTDHPLAKANDWWSWSAPGPGSLRGLSWYFYGQPDVAISARRYPELIEKCYDEVSPLIQTAMPIHMQDFQNCLCEFSKYMRIINGDRRVRNKYRPR
jgi:hypothetical protein